MTYYWVLVGVLALVVGIGNLAHGRVAGWGAIVFGLFAIGCGVFAGPRQMFRRIFRRPR